MRNVKNILKLADFIESEKYQFDMRDSSATPSCGTAGCIGGHAAVLWKEVRQYWSDTKRTEFGFNQDMLIKNLGLRFSDMNTLCFTPRTSSGVLLDYDDITRTHAVEALRHLAKTGKVRFLRRLPKKESSTAVAAQQGDTP